jgi:hypothetical protein
MGAQKAKICGYPIAHELGDETLIARDRARAGVLVSTDDFPLLLGINPGDSAVEPTRSQNMTVSWPRSATSGGARTVGTGSGPRPALRLSAWEAEAAFSSLIAEMIMRRAIDEDS